MNAITIINAMSKDEARDCVRDIKDRASEMGTLLLELKTREGWRPLGYHTWTECLVHEFSFTRKYLYELMKAAPIIETMSHFGYILNTRQATVLARYPETLRSAIVQITESRYGKITESRLERVGQTILQAVCTGAVNMGDGSETRAFDEALKLEDLEAAKRQWEYKNEGRTVISFKNTAELVSRLLESLEVEQLQELIETLMSKRKTAALIG